jgi:hypothetical protein
MLFRLVKVNIIYICRQRYYEVRWVFWLFTFVYGDVFFRIKTLKKALDISCLHDE